MQELSKLHNTTSSHAITIPESTTHDYFSAKMNVVIYICCTFKSDMLCNKLSFMNNNK